MNYDVTIYVGLAWHEWTERYFTVEASSDEDAGRIALEQFEALPDLDTSYPDALTFYGVLAVDELSEEEQEDEHE